MGGIFMAEAIGAYIRFLLHGCRKPYHYYLDDKKNRSGIPRNFIIGFITMFLILFIIIHIISALSN